MGDFYVPWAINGAKVPAELTRAAYQQQVGEGSGVVRPADLKVQQLNVPGTGFRMAPGAASVQSRDAEASARQSYGVYLASELVVSPVPGTGSGETRRDLVILEVTDPGMESVTYPDPVDEEGWADGDNFCRVTVIPNVDALVAPSERPVRSLDQITTGDWAHVTGVALAAINWPASTGTVTDAMIEDLRQVHSPREMSVTRAFGLSGVSAESLTAAHPAGETWPDAAAADTRFSVDVPVWATEAVLVETVSGVQVPGGGNADGWHWVQVGNDGDKVLTEATRWDVDETSGRHRVTLVTGDTIQIPAAYRGKKVRFYPRGSKVTGANDKSLVADTGTSVVLQVTFREVAE